jgi:hypothetical protein
MFGRWWLLEEIEYSLDRVKLEEGADRRVRGDCLSAELRNYRPVPDLKLRSVDLQTRKTMKRSAKPEEPITNTLHGEGAADRYLAHLPCEQLESAKLYAVHSEILGEPPLETTVRSLAQKYGPEFRREWGWAAQALKVKKVTFTLIAAQIKMEFMRPYFRSASEQIHASSSGGCFCGPG